MRRPWSERREWADTGHSLRWPGTAAQGRLRSPRPAACATAGCPSQRYHIGHSATPAGTTAQPRERIVVDDRGVVAKPWMLMKKKHLPVATPAFDEEVMPGPRRPTPLSHRPSTPPGAPALPIILAHGCKTATSATKSPPRSAHQAPDYVTYLANTLYHCAARPAHERLPMRTL